MRKPKIFYGWIVVAVTFFILLASASTRSTPSILIVPLQKEFGWSRAVISAPIAVNIFLYGLLGPFAAAMYERFGLRRMVCGALLCMGLGVILSTIIKEPWQMMICWGGIVGAGTGTAAAVMGATIANRWFVRHSGLVMGILTASTATGQLLFLPALASLGADYGWRFSAYAVAGGSFLMLIPAALLLRDYPSDMGLPRYGETTVTPRIKQAVNPAKRAIASLLTGLRSRDFWILAGSFFICGATTNGLVGTHLVPACIDHGIPEVRAAGLLAIMGFFDLIGTSGSGWLTDRLDSRKLLAWYYGLRGLSLFFLPYAFDIKFYGLSVFAVFYGLDWIATVPPTVRLAANAFGRENAAIMFGWIFVAHQLGAGLAAWLAGLIRTVSGDYFNAFVSAGALCLFAAVMVMFIPKAPQTRHRPEPHPTAEPI